MKRLLPALCVLFTTSAVAQTPAFEGPLPADRGRNLTATGEPNTLSVGARAFGVYFDRDTYLGAAVALGLEHRFVRFHVTAPVQARVWDFAPEGAPSGPAACRFLSCQLVVSPESGAFAPLRLLSMIDRFEIRTPYDIVGAALGPLTLQQGSGALVDRLRGRLAHTDAQTALRLNAGFPDKRVQGSFAISDVSAPLSFIGAHVSVRPAAFLLGTGDPLWLRLLSRATLSIEAAGDALTATPAQTRYGTTWPAGWGGLYAAAASASWPVFAPGQMIQFEPGVSTSAVYGLRAPGAASAGIGAGARGGARLRVNLPYVAFSVDGRAGASTVAHRHSVFGPLYTLERRGAIGSAGPAPARMVTEGETPAGFSGRLLGDIRFWHWLRAGMSLHIDNAPGRNHANGFVEVGAAGAHLYASAWRRGFSGRIVGEAPRAREALTFDDAWLGVLAADAAVWGPFSIFARAVLAPRARKAGYRTDVDVTIGVSSDVQLTATDWLSF